jgi:hydrogenase maturation protease
MRADVVVLAVGNRSRGDDALGPLLLERLRDWIYAHGLGREFELFEEYQLQLENALDLENRRLALFIDASREASSPVEFGAIGARDARAGHSTHALHPGTVLSVYLRVTGEAPPPAFFLGVRGTDFELGNPLSEAARAAMEDAWSILQELVRCPRHAEWQTMAAIARTPRALPA